MNKVRDGTAFQSNPPVNFSEGLMKFNPKLFDFYERFNLKKRKQTMQVIPDHMRQESKFESMRFNSVGPTLMNSKRHHSKDSTGSNGDEVAELSKYDNSEF